jgi:hypothetical protein
MRGLPVNKQKVKFQKQKRVQRKTKKLNQILIRATVVESKVKKPGQREKSEK